MVVGERIEGMVVGEQIGDAIVDGEWVGRKADVFLNSSNENGKRGGSG